jgi:uncharacterized phiE125 gp8 family phage protein
VDLLVPAARRRGEPRRRLIPMTLRLVTPPTKEPIELETEAKKHLRVDGADEDAYITQKISVARGQVEGDTERAFLTQTWELRLDRFPCTERGIELPLPPLKQVNSVKYLDTTGVLQTVDPSNYSVITPLGPEADRGRIVPVFGVYWPITQYVPDAVRVEYIAGYGDNATDVPAELRSAILLRLGELYGLREPAVVGTILADTGAYDRLIFRFKSLRAA